MIKPIVDTMELYSKQTGELLSSESSSTNPATVYHLDQEANYRKGFRTTHIKGN